MTENTLPSPSSEHSFSWKQGFYRLLIAPHASITDLVGRGRALLLAALSLVFLAGLLVTLAFEPASFGTFLALMIVVASSYALSRTKYYNLGALLFSFGMVLYAYISLFLVPTQSLQTAVSTYVPIALILASILISRKAFVALGISATLLIFLSTIFSRVPIGEEHIRLAGMIFSTAAVLFSIALYRDNVERSRINELQLTNRELEGVRSGLESRVQDRTLELTSRTDELAQRSKDLAEANFRLERRSAQFEAISQVSRSIASIRDLQSLLPGITSVISRSFGFYHVGIFLIDANREYAILSASNSEGGQRMIARQHRLLVGQEGIVGYVAGKGQPRIALDVGEDAVFFNNPDLPETHSEMGLPLRKSDAVIGVLDVQSTEANAFSQEDVDLLLLLADQVSLAIENARLFDDARRSLAEAESFSRQYLREGWGRLASEQQMVGYRYDRTGAAPLSRPVEMTPSGPNDESVNRIGVPIELRGEVIGDLVVQAPLDKKWTQDELDLIKAVAERVALSAENARLFEETSRRAERERMVSDITSRIRSTNDPNEMIKMALQELKSALGVTRVEVIPQRVSTGPKNGES